MIHNQSTHISLTISGLIRFLSSSPLRSRQQGLSDRPSAPHLCASGCGSARIDSSCSSRVGGGCSIVHTEAEWAGRSRREWERGRGTAEDGREEEDLQHVPGVPHAQDDMVQRGERGGWGEMGVQVKRRKKDEVGVVGRVARRG